METVSSIHENKENVAETPGKKSQRLSLRLKKSAGKVFEDVKESLNRPSSSRRNSDAELIKATPEKSSTTSTAPSTDGKGSVSKRKLSWRGLSSTFKSSLRKTFNFGSSSISEVGEDAMKLFGVELEQVLIQERIMGVATASTLVPHIIHDCLKYLIPAHCKEEGLFRVSGMQDDIQQLKQQFDAAASQASGFSVSAETNCHNVSGLLKLYVRELPSPLYPKNMHNDLFAAAKTENVAEREANLQRLAKMLPDSSYAVLKKITCALHDLTHHSESNKMTSANLSTVWAPNLMWDKDYEVDPQVYLQFSREVNQFIQVTIDHAKAIFGNDEAEEQQNQTQPKRKSIFDLEVPITESSESLTDSTNCEALTPRDRSDSTASMDLSPSERQLNGSFGTRFTSDSQQNVSSPGFDEMLALATTSGRKRPRSIWIGNAASIEESLASMTDSSTESAPSSFRDKDAKFKRGSSKRKSTRGADIISTSSAEMDPPAIKKRKIESSDSESIHSLADTTATASATQSDSNQASSASNRRSLRASIRKSLRLGKSRTSTTLSGTGPENPQQLLFFYYLDTDSSSGYLRKLVTSMNMIPLEIRNAANDKMSLEEALFFARTCEDLVLVRKSDKAYTVSHHMSDLSDGELKAMLSDETGIVKSPLIIVGSTMMCGYDKNLKDIFRYYMMRKKRSQATPQQ